jgi:tRNA dimethylallyltransferase
VGKTALLERLFLGRAEVVSADSVQVYRGFDIGSAKPSLELLRRLPHHLIDILDPREQYTAGDFVNAAAPLLREIALRGNIPVVSGGTAFYFRNLLYGLPATPPAVPALRAALEEALRSLGPHALFRRLQSLDPKSAERISPRDTYRVLRALEVYEASGRPLSEISVPREVRRDMDFLIIGLVRPREELAALIHQRVEAMFRAGLVREVAGLIRSGLDEASPGFRGIGYREFFLPRGNGCLRLKDIAEEIKTSSRRYAKRQLAFFRSIPGVRWFHPSAEGEIARLVEEFLR